MGEGYYGAVVSARFALLVLLAACGDDAMPSDAGVDAASCACTQGLPQRAGVIAIPEADEISGLTVSRSLPDTLWVHNDSGDSPRLFALTGTGASRGILTVTGATAIDWEDITSATCGDKPCVIVGDIGDNDLERATVQLYEIDEPSVIAGVATAAARKFDVAYPGGAVNSEALIFDPRDGATYVIAKVATSPATVYRLPRTAGGTAIAEAIGTLEVPGTDPRVTAADLFTDGCGTRLLVRTYGALFELRGDPDASVASLLALPRTFVPAASEPQGEAVAYLPDGRGYLTTSEGVSSALSRAVCQ